MNTITTSSKNAPLLSKWLKERGGIAVWKSIDLSDPGAETFTPAITEGKPTQKPHWKFANEPAFIITAAQDVTVTEDTEAKRFYVAIRMGGNGFAMKLTDAATAKVRKEVEKAGEGAYYEFDYDTQEAVIMKPWKKVPLTEWKEI